jgi:hypothetical protein
MNGDSFLSTHERSPDVGKPSGLLSSDWFDLFVVLCRLVLYGVEIWKARRDNGENSGS